MTDVLVIGGGAAGMMAALAAADQGAQVCLLERNPKVGAQAVYYRQGPVQRDEPLRRGAGACQHPRNSRFLYGAMTRTPPQWVENFFEELACP